MHYRIRDKKDFLIKVGAASLLLAVLVLVILAIIRSIGLNSMPLKVYVPNLKKADSFLVQCSRTNILIDTGNPEDGKNLVDMYKSYGVKKIDYLILTHDHKDHIGGALEILNNFEVGRVIRANYESPTALARGYYNFLKSGTVPFENLEQDKEIIIDDLKINLWPALQASYVEENDYSIVTKLTYKDISILFAGDAEKQRINELALKGNELTSTVLKIPHHGLYEKNSRTFIDMVDPKYTIITDSTDTWASDKLTVYLDEKGIENHNTHDGQFTLYSDGKEIVIQ